MVYTIFFKIDDVIKNIKWPRVPFWFLSKVLMVGITPIEFEANWTIIIEEKSEKGVILPLESHFFQY